jgi:hypothetical protein
VVRFETGIHMKHNRRSALSSDALNYPDRFALSYLIAVSMKFDKEHCSTQHFAPVPISKGWLAINMLKLHMANWRAGTRLPCSLPVS